MRTTTDTQNAKPKAILKKANDRFIRPDRFYKPSMLFDEFWREGELAMLFGQEGVGKSILAVQIAEALARGRAMEGFRMPHGRRKVLYVDLKLSDRQFQMRYSRRERGEWKYETYRFADFLYRDRPGSPEDLCDWLEDVLPGSCFGAVIIDDLSAIGRGDSGQLLSVMRRLKRLTERYGIAVLVLADAAEPGRSGLVSEADLRRLRVLCSAADSVFAIGHHPRSPGYRYVFQTRSANAPVFWTTHNSPICSIVQDKDPLLRFGFDERFRRQMDPEELKLIRRVKGARDAGLTYREIESRFGISKSHAARLIKKWTPAMGVEACEVTNEEIDRRDAETQSEVASDECRVASEEAGGIGTTVTSDERQVTSENPGNAGALACMSDSESDRDQSPREEEEDVSREDAKTQSEEKANDEFGISNGDCESPEQKTPPRRRTIRSLKRAVNAAGTEIFIESENTIGQPEIWYQVDSRGNFVRYRRKLYAVNVEVIGRSPYLPV